MHRVRQSVVRDSGDLARDQSVHSPREKSTVRKVVLRRRPDVVPHQVRQLLLRGHLVLGLVVVIEGPRPELAGGIENPRPVLVVGVRVGAVLRHPVVREQVKHATVGSCLRGGVPTVELGDGWACFGGS